jgi:hypothetical protein
MSSDLKVVQFLEMTFVLPNSRGQVLRLTLEFF